MTHFDPARPIPPNAGAPYTGAPYAGQPLPAARPRRKRSVAWVYYTILAVLCLVGAFSVGPSALLPAVLCGAYATYLFRGGRFVLWIW